MTSCGPRLFLSFFQVFHIPFQSGDDDVLKGMRRGYTRDKYLSIVQNIRNEFGEEASITADLIVGFPGETDEQFQKTLDVLREVRCKPQLSLPSHVHVATKSSRPGEVGLVTTFSSVARSASTRAWCLLILPDPTPRPPSGRIKSTMA
jgi:hypothetical protein